MTTNLQTNAQASFSVAVGKIPEHGSHSMEIDFDFTTLPTINFDLLDAEAQRKLDFVQGCFIDNSGNAQPVTMKLGNTNALFSCPAYSQGFFPLNCTQTPRFTLSSTGGVIVPVHFFDYPTPAEVWGANYVNGGAPGSGGGGGSGTSATSTSYFNAALSSAPQVIKAAPGQINSFSFDNSQGATDAYVNFYDSLAAVVGTTAIKKQYRVPADTVKDFNFVAPPAFTTGISIAAVLASDGVSAPTTALNVNVEFI